MYSLPVPVAEGPFWDELMGLIDEPTSTNPILPPTPYEPYPTGIKAGSFKGDQYEQKGTRVQRRSGQSTPINASPPSPPPELIRDIQQEWENVYLHNDARAKLESQGFQIVDQPARSLFEELGGIIPPEPTF